MRAPDCGELAVNRLSIAYQALRRSKLCLTSLGARSCLVPASFPVSTNEQMSQIPRGLGAGDRLSTERPSDPAVMLGFACMRSWLSEPGRTRFLLSLVPFWVLHARRSARRSWAIGCSVTFQKDWTAHGSRGAPWGQAVRGSAQLSYRKG